MTEDKLIQGTELREKIRCRKRDLKYISDFEKGKYRDYPLKLCLLFMKGSCGSYDVTNDVFLYDEELKKNILNSIKIYFIADIQRLEKELEQL